MLPFIYVVDHFSPTAPPMRTGGVALCETEAEFFALLATWNAAPENAWYKYGAAVPETPEQHAVTALGGIFATVKERINPA